MMSEKERILVPELTEAAAKLPYEARQRLLWMMQGMIFAGEHGKNDRRTSN